MRFLQTTLPRLFSASVLLGVLSLSARAQPTKQAADAVPTAVQLIEPAQQILRFGNGAEPRELDPTTASGVPESHIVGNLFKGLTDYDPLTLKPIPAIAESWEISKDGKTYTFKLRKDAKWSDGTQITANDFVASWQRALAPETASEYAYQLFYIKNGKDFNGGKLKDPSALGIKATDPLTFEVTLERPVPYFLSLTSFHTLYPTPQHVIKKFPGREWTKEGNMVCSGPFMLKEWRINQHIKLVPNPHYWNKDKVHLKEVYILPIENVDTEDKAFWAGEIHFTENVPLVKIPGYAADAAKVKQAGSGYHPYQVAPYLGSYYYRFNTTKPPFNDPRVRKAFTLALDRQLLIDKVTRKGELAADSFTPPGIEGYDFVGTLPRTVDQAVIAQAKDLLKQAGYPEGKGFPKVDILYNTNENHKKIALAIQQMWKKNLGVDVGLFNQEWKVYLDSQRNMQFDISRAGWIGDYPDPNTFLDMYISGASNNQTGWANKEYDKNIELAAQTADHSQRLEYFRRAEAILMEELPVLPIYVYTRARLVSEKVKLVLDKDKIVPWKGNLTDRLLLEYYALAK